MHVYIGCIHVCNNMYIIMYAIYNYNHIHTCDMWFKPILSKQSSSVALLHVYTLTQAQYQPYLVVDSGYDSSPDSHAHHKAAVEVLVEEQGLDDGRHEQQCSVHISLPVRLCAVLSEPNHQSAGRCTCRHTFLLAAMSYRYMYIHNMPWSMHVHDEQSKGICTCTCTCT